MNHPLRISMLVLAALHAWSDPAMGSEVWVVAETGGDFTQLQPAINAAAAGDVILVRRDLFGEVAVIDGKGLTLLADPVGVTFHVQQFALTVKNTPAGSNTILRGIRVANQVGAAGTIELADCLGHVHLEDIDLIGPEGVKTVLVATDGRTPLAVRNCASVSMHSCEFMGGRGFDACLGCLEYGIPLPATLGGPGATVIDSRISAHDCSFLGGAGGALLNGIPITSGNGLEVSGGSMSLSGATAVAGHGIGNGLQLTGSFVKPNLLHDSSLLPGTTGGVDLIAPPGSTLVLAGNSRHFTLNGPLREQEIAHGTLDGEPGDLVLLAIGLGGGTTSLYPLVGWFEVGFPLVHLIPVVTLGAPDGVVAIDVAIPELPTELDAVTVHLQPFFLAANGAFAGPSTPLVMLSSEH